MIKTSQNADPAPEVAESSLLECWARDNQVPCLRVELADPSVFIFPYGQFVFAQLTGTPSQQTLHASFASHAVKVTGSDLAEIFKALQTLSVEWIKPTISRYAALVPKGSPKVVSITVENLAEQERQNGE